MHREDEIRHTIAQSPFNAGQDEMDSICRCRCAGRGAGRKRKRDGDLGSCMIDTCQIVTLNLQYHASAACSLPIDQGSECRSDVIRKNTLVLDQKVRRLELIRSAHGKLVHWDKRID